MFQELYMQVDAIIAQVFGVILNVVYSYFRHRISFMKMVSLIPKIKARLGADHFISQLAYKPSYLSKQHTYFSFIQMLDMINIFKNFDNGSAKSDVL